MSTKLALVPTIPAEDSIADRTRSKTRHPIRSWRRNFGYFCPPPFELNLTTDGFDTTMATPSTHGMALFAEPSSYSSVPSSPSILGESDIIEEEEEPIVYAGSPEIFDNYAANYQARQAQYDINTEDSSMDL